MVKELNRPGRAAGGGFYDYPKDGKKALWPELARIFGKPGVQWDLQEMKDRILYRQSIETARCLEEGVLMTAHDANIGSIYGIGRALRAAEVSAGQGGEGRAAALSGPRFGRRLPHLREYRG